MFNRTDHEDRKYNCIPITFSYVIRFSNRYASEVLTALRCRLIRETFQNVDEIKVLSIGCGPATEVIALEKFSREENKVIKYYGYDINPIWNKTQQILEKHLINTKCNTMFDSSEFQDDNKILPEIDILILNYVISDIHKHDKKNVNFFLENIKKIAEKMKSNSIIIINDVNSYYMGRDEIECWGNKLDKKNYLIAGAYFDYPGRYPKQKFSHLEKVKKFQMTPLLFDVSSTEGINNFIDNISECRSAFILIKKIGGFS